MFTFIFKGDKSIRVRELALQMLLTYDMEDIYLAVGGTTRKLASLLSNICDLFLPEDELITNGTKQTLHLQRMAEIFCKILSLVISTYH